MSQGNPTTMTDENEQLTLLRLDVRGIQTTLDSMIRNQDTAIASLTSSVAAHEVRLDDKKAAIATLQAEVLALQQDNTASKASIRSTMGLVLSGIVGLIALINFIRIPFPA